MFIFKIVTIFLSTVVGAASSDIHSPIALNTDEDVVSSLNLRSLAPPSRRELARDNNKKKPFDDDDDDGFGIPLSAELTITKNADEFEFKESLFNILRVILKNYDEDGTKVVNFELANDDENNGDGRELVAGQYEITVGFVLTLIDAGCQKLSPDVQPECYCNSAEDILILLNQFSVDLDAIFL